MRTRDFSKSPIKLSDTIHFEEVERGPIGDDLPAADAGVLFVVEAGEGVYRSGEMVPMEARLVLSSATRLVEFMVYVAGKQKVEGEERDFVQSAEAAHGTPVSDGEVLILPVLWRVPLNAVPGVWKVSMRVILENGTRVTESADFEVGAFRP